MMRCGFFQIQYLEGLALLGTQPLIGISVMDIMRGFWPLPTSLDCLTEQSRTNLSPAVSMVSNIGPAQTSQATATAPAKAGEHAATSSAPSALTALQQAIGYTSSGTLVIETNRSYAHVFNSNPQTQSLTVIIVEHSRLTRI